MLLGRLVNADRHNVPPASAIRWVVGFTMNGAGCYAAAPRASDEIRRLGVKQVGYYAACLEILRRAEPLLPLFGVPAEEIVSGLSRASWRRTDGLLKGLLKSRGVASSQIRDSLAGLPGQAAETIAKEFGDREPLELLVSALDGRLNHAPKAIARDVADAARPRARWNKFELTFAQITDSRVGTRKSPRQDPSDKEWEPPDSGRVPVPRTLQKERDYAVAARARLDELLAAAAVDLKLPRAYLEAEVEGWSREEIARRLRIFVSLVDKRRRLLRNLPRLSHE